MGIITERKRRNYYGLDADKSLIPAAALSVDDTFFATDTKLSYVWDGSNWVSLGAPAVGVYVPRTITGFDFTELGLTLNGNWQVDGFDFSAVVPVGAIAVAILLRIKDDVSATKFFISPAESFVECVFSQTQVADLYLENTAVLRIPADRKLDYNGDSGMDYIGVAVVGWFI